MSAFSSNLGAITLRINCFILVWRFIINDALPTLRLISFPFQVMFWAQILFFSFKSVNHCLFRWISLYRIPFSSLAILLPRKNLLAISSSSTNKVNFFFIQLRSWQIIRKPLIKFRQFFRVYDWSVTCLALFCQFSCSFLFCTLQKVNIDRTRP